MILLILIQRGKGGGLAGAFGGMGGQSAFGTKAGDMFTKITVIVAVLWFLLCIFSILGLKSSGVRRLKLDGGPAAAGAAIPAEGTATGSSDAAGDNTSNAPESSAPTSSPAPAE